MQIAAECDEFDDENCWNMHCPCSCICRFQSCATFLTNLSGEFNRVHEATWTKLLWMKKNGRSIRWISNFDRTKSFPSFHFQPILCDQIFLLLKQSGKSSVYSYFFFCVNTPPCPLNDVFISIWRAQSAEKSIVRDLHKLKCAMCMMNAFPAKWRQ